MSTFFISDLHFGHRKMRLEGNNRVFDHEHTDSTPHDHWLCEQWCSVVKSSKRDVVYCLGDVAFNNSSLTFLNSLPGRKILVRGNHDQLKTSSYLEVFENILGLHKYKQMWLSHAPIHPDSLRGLPNIHGHTHHTVINDKRYLNVCVEMLNGIPISLEQVREKLVTNK